MTLSFSHTLFLPENHLAWNYFFFNYSCVFLWNQILYEIHSIYMTLYLYLNLLLDFILIWLWQMVQVS